MTIMTATATPKFGIMSADTLVYGADQFQSWDCGDISQGTFDAYHRATWCGDGKPPSVRARCYKPKIWTFPRLKMAIGGAGSAELVARWAAGVRALVDKGLVHNIHDLDTAAQDVLPDLQRLIDDVPQRSVVTHLGWSKRERRVVGRSFTSINGFAPEPFMGHSFTIVPNRDTEGFDAVVEAAGPAEIGKGTEDFHVALTRNVETAYQAGLAVKWMHFGGELLAVKVDRHGVSEPRPIYRFADADKALALTASDNAFGFAASQPAQVGGHHDYFMKQVLGL